MNGKGGGTKLVLVEWIDSCSRDTWHDIEIKTDPVSIVSVGYLTEDEKGYITIAGSISDLYKLGNALSIPRVCITKIYTLRRGKELKTNVS